MKKLTKPCGRSFVDVAVRQLNVVEYELHHVVAQQLHGAGVAGSTKSQSVDIQFIGNGVHHHNVECGIGSGVLKTDLIFDVCIGQDIAFAQAAIHKCAFVVGIKSADIGLAIPPRIVAAREVWAVV